MSTGMADWEVELQPVRYANYTDALIGRRLKALEYQIAAQHNAVTKAEQGLADAKAALASMLAEIAELEAHRPVEAKPAASA